MIRNMIGHHHVRIPDFLVDHHGLDKVDVAFVRIDLLKTVALPANVPEMDVEDLLARTEVTNHIEDFLARILAHYRDGSLAEVQSMVGTLLDGDELFESVDRPEHGIHALVPFRRHTWIVRMAGHANLVFRRNRNHSFKKVGDSFPVKVRLDGSRPRKRTLRFGFLEPPGTVGRTTASRRSFGPQHAEDAHVVFDGRNPGLGAVLDQFLNGFDISVPFRALAQHDGPPLGAIDVARREKRGRYHIDADVVFLGALPELHQLLYGRVAAFRRLLRIAANVVDGVALEKLEPLFRSRRTLTAQLHKRARAAGRLSRRPYRGGRRDAGGGQRSNKFSAIHRLAPFSVLAREHKRCHCFCSGMAYAGF